MCINALSKCFTLLSLYSTGNALYYVQGIEQAAFNLLFAFDEVISLGYKENITVQQVKQVGWCAQAGYTARPHCAWAHLPHRSVSCCCCGHAAEHGDGLARGEAAQDDHCVQGQ